VKRILVSSGILILYLAAGCGQQQQRVESVIEVPVSVEEIALSSIEEYTSATGTVIAARKAVITSESAGYYRLAVNPATGKKYVLGDFVKKGDVIVYLDNPEQENSIRIDSVNLSLDSAQREFEKQKTLYEKGGVTLSELNAAERSYVDAKYSYENAQIQLAKMKVTPSIDGVIVRMPIYTEGVRVASGSEIASIMDYRKLLMEIQLPGTLLTTVTVGQNLRVTNYTRMETVLDGLITEVSPALDPETRTFIAKVTIDNPDMVFRPGMFVKAEIVTARHDDTIVIPKNLVMASGDNKYVFIVEEGFARSRRITTGLENPDMIEVLEGLSPEERLVTSGFETLRNGAKVTIAL